MYQAIRLSRRRAAAEARAVALAEQTAGSDPAARTTNGATALQRLDEAARSAVEAAMKRPEFSLPAGGLRPVYVKPGGPPVFLLGLGRHGAGEARHLRQAAAALARDAFNAGVRSLAVDVDEADRETMGPAAAGEALGEGLAVGNLQFTRFSGAAAGADKPRLKLEVQLTGDAHRDFSRAVECGLATGESANVARRLAATPPNVADPRYFIGESRRVARQAGLRIRILARAELKRLGLNGLLAVGGAGSQPPALICLEHRPAGSAAARRGRGRSAAAPQQGDGPILLVGKAVTFDTGGYSLKPREGMTGMKYDKCGGTAVLGAMHAVGTLGLEQHVVGLIPVVENMIDREAYRVDDILTMANGVTVEVTNTDAEGRLILADAMAWGCRQYKPRAVIDLATLTGGVVIALGTHCAGLFCNDEALRQRLIAAGERTGERLWPLPLWPEHRELMKGTHADLVNSGQRKAHPIQGAAFLSFFVGEDAPKAMPAIPWAHLDIAGVAALEKAEGNLPIGPTGFGVRLLTRLIENW